MALMENEVNQRVPKVQAPTDTLTFVTTEGEQIIFDGMDIPVEEVVALIGEEALAKIWNRPAEDAAWRGI